MLHVYAYVYLFSIGTQLMCINEYMYTMVSILSSAREGFRVVKGEQCLYEGHPCA